MSDIFTLIKKDESYTEIPIPEKLIKLVENFKNNFVANKEHQVESQVRIEYIDPLLELLGWDVSNSSGLPPSKREVIYEPRQIVDGNKLAPDYSLCIDGKRKIYVEAKRISENVLKNKNHAYQLRRYSWNAGLPFGILTDFEEFAIYDCRTPPKPEDSAEVARIGYLHFENLINHWSEIYSLFSKQALEAGALEKVSENKLIQKGTQTIDISFLHFMKQWRKKIAQNVAIENLDFDATLIDYETQALLNKIIFLRILEDRGLEPSNSLIDLAKDKFDFLQSLDNYFKRANSRYNSGLFSGSGLGSMYLKIINKNLIIDQDILAEFISSLYYPNPFEFSVMPADILGKIYEFMLSEDVSIVDEKSRTIEVNLKPEVKKKGGVFYTPSTIVQYIVEETIGPLIKGKSPSEIYKIKIIDPASGSGSFLVSAYQYLIDHCTDYYSHNNKSKKLIRGSDGNYKLIIDERRKLLENCIFGVDIDAQAIEVSKLSLLLKLVENESQFQLDIGHLLPNIDKNICCGNSLIDLDFQQSMINSEFDSDFNPFSWKKSFPEVFDNGGFDAVIGNPPYLNVDAIWGKKDSRLGYLKSHYSHIYQDKTDLLFYFLEKSVSICKGEIGMIVSRSFIEADKAVKLRTWLSNNARVREILDFRGAAVFKGVGINTLILNLTKSKAITATKIKKWKSNQLPIGYSAKTLRDSVNFESLKINSEQLNGNIWNFGDSKVQSLLEKIDSSGQTLGKITTVGQGMQTGLNEAFEISEEVYDSIKIDHPRLVYPRITNSSINQFSFGATKKYIIYPEEIDDIQKLPKEIVTQLNRNQKELKNRAAFLRGDCEWYKYTFPLHKEIFSAPKIVSPYMAKKCTFAVDENKYAVYLTDTTVIYITNESIPYYALCAVLNSDIIDFRFYYLTKLKGGGQKEFFAKQIEKIPVPLMNITNPLIVELDEYGKFISQKIEILKSTQILAEQKQIQSDIHVIKSKIEAAVGRLFNLTKEDLDLIYLSRREWT